LYLKKNQLDRAEGLLSAEVEAFPESYDALALLGLLNHRQGRGAAAEAASAVDP
jgi:hypothetical protein